ncbi:MAG: Xaa-Pro aminopeptidase [Gammaproteobacteria bacterium]|nr:MAG: Xaa-Pro aminopeptidase [Gammaproteobacteria bacterium]RLA53413.1 MAG: Xaa-Pro aminopeptidase [Gammaproteobacteria bacterium]
MIKNKEFARRRRDLMAMMEKNSIAIVTAAPERVRSRDTYFPYRQDSDFHYLSGFPEPEAVLVLIPGRAHGEFVLFCRDRDRDREIWDGYRAGPTGACKDYGADDAFPITDIDEILPGLLEGRERVYYAVGKDRDFDQSLMDWVNDIRGRARSGAVPPGEFIDLDHLLHEMRLFKKPAELTLMRKASRISAAAHCRAMKTARSGISEYHLQAEIEHQFAMDGASFPAYSSIVGGGKNACVLHYVVNDSVLKDGDLVLIDAGCEYHHYAADITRTFPVNGIFTSAQKAIYELVLNAQLAAIDVVQAGRHWDEPHQVTIEVITAGLVDLGLLKGNVSKLIDKGAYRDFYMHRAGHWLGMDVHDVGDYKVDNEWRLLEPGMVMTVEPGIYIAPDNTKVAKKWRGIGIRIEDDVLITRKGPEVLTAGVPKTIADIEALMAKGQGAKTA